MTTYRDILTNDEVRAVRECMYICDIESIFPDWEFTTLFGIEREKLRECIKLWPDIDISDEEFLVAVSNSIAYIILYPWKPSDIERDAKASIAKAILAKIPDRDMDPLRSIMLA